MTAPGLDKCGLSCAVSVRGEDVAAGDVVGGMCVARVIVGLEGEVSEESEEFMPLLPPRLKVEEKGGWCFDEVAKGRYGNV